jgi:uridine kinase
MNEENKIRPFLMGIVDGSLSNKFATDLYEKLENGPVCRISMSNYLKDGSKKEDEACPEFIDFKLLIDNLSKLLDNEDCSIPIYDFKTKKRSSETKTIKSCQIIILEGLLCFYDNSIRSMMDLKIFIETGNDIRFAETVSKEMENKNTNLTEIINKYFDEIKPTYNYFIHTKKYGDIILPNETEYETAMNLIINYLELLLSRVNNRKENIFYFINEIIDSKYEFCKDNLILKREKSSIDLLRAVFEDLIKKRQDEEFVDEIRKHLVEMIEKLLSDYLEKCKEIKLVFDTDDITNYDFKDCDTVFFYKTSILNPNDIKKPQYILSKNKDCNVIICSIFLAPRFAHLILGNQMNSILFITLYFSEFFVKYEKIIKDDTWVFNDTELKKLVKQMISKIEERLINYFKLNN